MSVSGLTNRIPYSGNGVTTVFAFAQYLTAASDLKVLGTDGNGVVTTYVLNTDYTFAGTLDANGVYSGGGNITFSVAPASGITLSLYRDVPETQPNNWVDGDSDPASAKITAFDRAVLQIQRLKDLIVRSVGLPDGSVQTFNPQLPTVMPANATLQVNPAGTGWTLTPPSVTTPAAPQKLTAGTGVAINTAAMFQTIFIASNTGANVDMSGTNPQIAAGALVGQVVALAAVDPTYTINFANGNGLARNGSYTMLNGSVSMYLWDGTLWRMICDNEIG